MAEGIEWPLKEVPANEILTKDDLDLNNLKGLSTRGNDCDVSTGRHAIGMQFRSSEGRGPEEIA